MCDAPMHQYIGDIGMAWSYLWMHGWIHDRKDVRSVSRMEYTGMRCMKYPTTSKVLVLLVRTFEKREGNKTVKQKTRTPTYEHTKRNRKKNQQHQTRATKQSYIVYTSIYKKLTNKKQDEKKQEQYKTRTRDIINKNITVCHMTIRVLYEQNTICFCLVIFFRRVSESSELKRILCILYILHIVGWQGLYQYYHPQHTNQEKTETKNITNQTVPTTAVAKTWKAGAFWRERESEGR